jgi:membrane-associated phospholipid phosphatase
MLVFLLCNEGVYITLNKEKGITMLPKFLLSLLLLIIICESSLFTQNKYNFSQFGNETWSFIKQPTKWEGSDWLKLGLISAGTYLVMQADQPIRDAVLKDQRYYKSVPIEFGRMWGELYSPFVLFSGFAVHSLLTDDIRTKKIAYEIGQASLYAGGVGYLLKLAIGRARPYMNEGKTSFHPFSSLFSQNYHSLPGGHSTAAFVLSTVLSRNAKPLWLKGIAYLPAVLTFVSRVYQDKHWTSDDFLGAVVGYFVATWVVDLHEQVENRIQMSSVYPLTIRIMLN